MPRQTPGRAILVASVILILILSGAVAQSSASGPDGVGPSANAMKKSSQAGPPGNASRLPRQNVAVRGPDPELAAVFKAEQDGRLLDAEKLLNAAISKAEATRPSHGLLRSLLNELASVENRLRNYPQAVAAEKRALAVDQALGKQAAPETIFDLQELAAYSKFAGDGSTFAQAAEQMLARARQYPGPHNSQLLMALSTVAAADQFEHRVAEAQALGAKEVRICQAQEKPRSDNCASVLAGYYSASGHRAYAERLLSEQATRTPVSAGANRFGAYWPKVAPLLTLARMYEADRSYDLAAATDRRIIAVIERTTKDPVEAAAFYDGLGRDLELEGRDAEAEAAYQHAFDLRERATGRLRLAFMGSLTKTPLVPFYEKQGRLADAEATLKRALADQRGVLDPHDARHAQALLQLARVKLLEGEAAQAEPLCARALKIQEADFGPHNRRLLLTLRTCAAVERQLGKTDQAEALATRATALRQKTLPPSRR